MISAYLKDDTVCLQSVLLPAMCAILVLDSLLKTLSNKFLASVLFRRCNASRSTLFPQCLAGPLLFGPQSPVIGSCLILSSLRIGNRVGRLEILSAVLEGQATYPEQLE